MVKNSPTNAGDTRDMSSISGLGRSLGEGNGNPLRYSCLENSMDRGAWWATVHGFAELDTTEHARACTHTHTHTHTHIHLRMDQLLNQTFHNYVQFSHSVMSDSLRPHELQHARPPCPSPTPGVHSNSRPSGRWCHPAISSFVIPFSSCPQSLRASESFPMSQLFAWGGQSAGISALASLLPKNTQDWSPLEWTGWITLQSKGLSRVFSNTTVQKHQFFGAQLSSQSNSHIHTWPLEKP